MSLFDSKSLLRRARVSRLALLCGVVALSPSLFGCGSEEGSGDPGNLGGAGSGGGGAGSGGLDSSLPDSSLPDGASPDGSSDASSDGPGPTGPQVWETLEWTKNNATFSGNPYDLVAKAVFKHPASGSNHTTEMFYVGGNKWKFRFTGTKTGKWTYTTICDGSAGTSKDPDLHGDKGTINVVPQTNPLIKGFLTHKGNKFAIMDRHADDLKGHIFQVYMNQQRFEQQYTHSSRIWDDPIKRKPLIKKYWDDTRDNGFNAFFVALFYSWFKKGALDANALKPADYNAPDLDVFETLEYAIKYAHQRGGRVHIWAFGDNDRKQTANFIPGGVMGPAHQRIMRYIAARLGPLPGWSMNFGFDTNELPNPKGITSQWAKFINARSGWKHLLCARGWDHPAFGINSYAGFSGSYDLTTTASGPASYAEIKADMDARKDKPHLYEERHTYERFRYVPKSSCQEPGEAPKDQYGKGDGFACWPHNLSSNVKARLNVQGSRRLIWWETMAGGMGGFFGHFSTRFNAYGPFSSKCGCGYHPASLKASFRSFRDFWAKGRFKLDMVVQNHRVQGATGYCLASASKKSFVAYVQDADKVTLNLGDMAGSQPVVIVDTKKDYVEIPKGTFKPGNPTISFGSKSDWAVAVGK